MQAKVQWIIDQNYQPTDHASITNQYQTSGDTEYFSPLSVACICVRNHIYFNNLVGSIFSGLRFSAPKYNEAMPLKLQTCKNFELKWTEKRA